MLQIFLPFKTTPNNLHDHENKQNLLPHDLGHLYFDAKTDGLLEPLGTAETGDLQRDKRNVMICVNFYPFLQIASANGL